MISLSIPTSLFVETLVPLAKATWMSLNLKVAVKSLSSIVIRIDYFNFSAICFFDLMSTCWLFILLMFCSHTLRCSFTLISLLERSYFWNLAPVFITESKKMYCVINPSSWSLEDWGLRGVRLRFLWKSRHASWTECMTYEKLPHIRRKNQSDQRSSRVCSYYNTRKYSQYSIKILGPPLIGIQEASMDCIFLPPLPSCCNAFHWSTPLINIGYLSI